MKIGYALPGVKLCGLPSKTCQATTDGWYKETCDSVLAVGNWNLAAKPHLCPAKYPEKFARKYRQRCPHLCNHLHRDVYTDLNPELYLDLNPDLNPRLYRALFA